VAAYEARWPIGTKERVWLDVLLYTGLRRGDAVRLGRQHVRDGVATLRTEKSQETGHGHNPDPAGARRHARRRPDRRTRLHLRRERRAH
jgi:integrase